MIIYLDNVRLDFMISYKFRKQVEADMEEIGIPLCLCDKYYSSNKINGKDFDTANYKCKVSEEKYNKFIEKAKSYNFRVFIERCRY